MKKKEFISMKGLSVKELGEKVRTLEKEVSDLVVDKNMKKLKDLKIIHKKRKEIAQFKTLIAQKELLGKLEAKR